MNKLSDGQQWVLLFACMVIFTLLAAWVGMWIYNLVTGWWHRYKSRRRRYRW
jgi:hypothetical protein